MRFWRQFVLPIQPTHTRKKGTRDQRINYSSTSTVCVDLSSFEKKKHRSPREKSEDFLLHFKVTHVGMQPRRILSSMTTADVRTGFLRQKILFNGKEDFHQDLHKKQVCMIGKGRCSSVFVENSQTPKSSSKTPQTKR